MSKVVQANPSGGGQGGKGGGQQQQSSNRQQGLRNNQPNSNSPRTSISGQQNQNNKSNTNTKGNNASTTTSTATPNTNTNTSTNINPNVLTELKGSISKPVRLVLEDGKTETGLVWAYDLKMSVVVLEIPESVGFALGRVKNEQKKYLSSAIVSHSKTVVSNVKAVEGTAANTKTNFEVIKLRSIQRVERIQTSTPETTTAANGTKNQSAAVLQALQSAKLSSIKGDINVSAAEARERLATAEALKRASKIGVGVSKLGQDVFDALSKTLPCRWADQHIIVMDEFVISPEKYDSAVIPNVPLSTLQAISEGKEVAGAPTEARGQATRWQRVTKVLDGERRKILANQVNVG